ncbi:hypothetical protein ASF98_18655 [Arthrobacter sp. Leaf337]|uniref:conjugal transfer protein n=1 Tax=Arthrobacter sp. Leaf337 TaxID=1736342 RepID=UPI0006FC3EB2|nr:conjugal transfer protein [Arthrobacter sp. Leaf337]KQR80316.1 hypothetical protein ASF98_18655 [Arthrobacter sp. Leaf337]
MKTPWTKDEENVEPVDSVEAASVAGTMTKVHSLSSKALVTGFYVIIALTVMVSFTALALAVMKEVPSEAATTSGFESRVDDGAGAYAEAFVASWLSASSNDHAALDTYLDSSGTGSLPKTGWLYRDIAVSGTERPEGSTLAAVTVAANVKETKTIDGKPVETWPRRYFRAVINTDDGLSPVGLPAPVSAPAPAGSNVTLRYPESISTNSEVATTATSFLSAYATGAGGLDRYTTPGNTITPISPVPFTTATIRSLNADKVPSSAPKDGETLNILAAVGFETDQDQGSSSTYAMALTARAGRWEVSSLSPVPQVEKSTSPTAIPTERPAP